MKPCHQLCTFQAEGNDFCHFGNLAAHTETAFHSLACAQLHATTSNGGLLRNDRPECLCDRMLARIMPLVAMNDTRSAALEISTVADVSPSKSKNSANVSFLMESLMNTASTVATAGTTDITDTTRTLNSLLFQLTASAALGLVVFYGVAFSESPLLHNAAHDVRHITIQPCH